MCENQQLNIRLLIISMSCTFKLVRYGRVILLRAFTQIFTLKDACSGRLASLMTNSGRGAFIVLEGLDRSGKTTQTTKLVQRVEKLGKSCKLIKFPGTFVRGEY